MGLACGLRHGIGCGMHAACNPLRGSLDRSKGDPDWDLRKTEKYSGYGAYDFKAVIPPFPEAPPEAVLTL